MVQPILLLGDPRLYENSSPVSQEDLPGLRRTVKDLHDTLMAFREKYHAGRAIAGPSGGILESNTRGPRSRTDRAFG